MIAFSNDVKRRLAMCVYVESLASLRQTRFKNREAMSVFKGQASRPVPPYSPRRWLSCVQSKHVSNHLAVGGRMSLVIMFA
jgi:hypothetical protein